MEAYAIRIGKTVYLNFFKPKFSILEKIVSLTIFLALTQFQLSGQKHVMTPDSTMAISKEGDTTSVVYHVSMIKLIVSPELYHGKEIIIAGFLNLEFEGTAIYLHQEDYENGLNKNGFWVNFSKEITMEQLSNANRNYVSIRGTFDMTRRGHFGLWSGSLSNITQVIPLFKRE